MKRLEKSGIIVGYRAIVSSRGRGSRIEAWASVRLVDASSDITDQFEQLIAATPEIVEAHRIAGDNHYTLRFCAGDFDVWNAFRKAVAELGCEARSRFDILVESLK